MTGRAPHTHKTSGRRDTGSAATELALLTPLLILVLFFVVAVGRLAHAQLLVTDAAHQAARAATTARDPATATTLARAAAATALDGHASTCRHPSVTVDTSRFRPGGIVAVTVDCTTTLTDVSLLRLPGQQHVTARFTAPIDVYRGNT